MEKNYKRYNNKVVKLTENLNNNNRTVIARFNQNNWGYDLGHPYDIEDKFMYCGSSYCANTDCIVSIEPVTIEEYEFWKKEYIQFHKETVEDKGYDSCEENLDIISPLLSQYEQPEYVNPLGQRVVDVDCGYKIYDSERTDAIILRVGDDYNGKYVYIDKKPIYEKTSDICFMSTPMLMAYEKTLKMIGYTDSFTDEQKLEKIIKQNIECGLKGSDVILSALNSGKDPMEYFEEFLKEYLE